MSLTKVTYSMIDGTTVNVLDYGASPSASASENKTAFEAAIAAAKNVYVPAGTYLIADPGIQLQNNTRIFGDGAETILQKSADTNSYILYASNKSNIIIENIATDGARTFTDDYSNSKFCIYLAACTDCTIRGVHAYGSIADNIVIEYGTGNIVDSCVVTDCNKDGIYFSGSENGIISNNICRGNGCGAPVNTGGGIAIAASWGITVTGNVSYDSSQFEIILSRASRFCTVVGNTFGSELSGQAGLSFYCLAEQLGGTLHGVNYGDGSIYYGASNCVIANNSCFAEARFELFNDCVITNNSIAKSSGEGIWLLGCTRVSATNNRISDYTNYGVLLSGSAKNGGVSTTYCTVNDNQIVKAGALVATAISKSGTGNQYQQNTLNSNPVPSGVSFTPALSSDGSAPNITYSEQEGIYSIVGDIVFVRLRVTVNTVTSTGSGSMLITGLPLQSSIGEQAVLTVSRIGNTQSALTLTGLGLTVNSSSATLTYTPTSTSGSAIMAAADAIKAGFTFTASGCYRITA